MGKRAHGEGSITQRKIWRWQAATVTPEGKLKRHTVYCKTCEGSSGKLEKVGQQLATGTYRHQVYRQEFPYRLACWEKGAKLKASTLRAAEVPALHGEAHHSRIGNIHKARQAHPLMHAGSGG